MHAQVASNKTRQRGSGQNYDDESHVHYYQRDPVQYRFVPDRFFRSHYEPPVTRIAADQLSESTGYRAALLGAWQKTSVFGHFGLWLLAEMPTVVAWG